SRTVVSAGHSFEEYGAESGRRPRRRRISWHLEMDRIAGWVSKLRKPVGILACDDFRALQLLAACRLADVAGAEQDGGIGGGAEGWGGGAQARMYRGLS